MFFYIVFFFIKHNIMVELELSGYLFAKEKNPMDGVSGDPPEPPDTQRILSL